MLIASQFCLLLWKRDARRERKRFNKARKFHYNLPASHALSFEFAVQQCLKVRFPKSDYSRATTFTNRTLQLKL